ncbi:MAG TPA: hypothetical protein VL069_01050 [Opitutus sp.]|nr:hypothetical protein [Opitutus sp.]
MNDSLWVHGVQLAGAFHFVTLIFARFTPIPPRWDENLAQLPDIHRRFAIAQNFFIGSTIAFGGTVSLLFAPTLVSGSTAARIICAGIALWRGGRLAVLPWLRVWPSLPGSFWRAGFVLLLLECAIYAVAYGCLALR